MSHIVSRYLVLVDRLDTHVMEVSVVFARSLDDAITRSVESLPRSEDQLKVLALPLPAPSLPPYDDLSKLSILLDRVMDAHHPELVSITREPQSSPRVNYGWSPRHEDPNGHRVTYLTPCPPAPSDPRD